MAIIRSALAPRIRKKVGDTIFKRRLGQTIASQRPLTVKNPKTVKQVAQRAKFRIAMVISVFAKFYISTVFPKTTYRGTKFNKFTKFLMKKIQDVTFPLTVLTYANFNATKLGNGDGFNVVPLTVVAHAGKSITVTWDPLAFPTGAPTSGKMFIVAISLTGGVSYLSSDVVLFTAGTAGFFSASSPLKVGDSVIVALGQTYTDAGLIPHTSEFSFQAIVAPITILI